jgi:hypothetical protein
MFMNVSEAIKEIDSWLKKMANDEWEHQNGVTIESSDNPGWILSIDLPDGKLESSSKISDFVRKMPSIEGDVIKGKLRIYSSELSAVIEAAGLILKYNFDSHAD